jgi:hypothetical protein
VTRQEKYAEAIKMLETALDEIDQAGSVLLDLDPGWRNYTLDLYKGVSKKLRDVEDAKIDELHEALTADEPECTCVQVAADVFNADGCALCNPASDYNRRAA